MIFGDHVRSADSSEYRNLFEIVASIGERHTSSPARAWFAVREGHGFDPVALPRALERLAQPAAVEVLGDPWAMLVLRDIMFGDRRHCCELIAGSEEGIATNILASRLKQLVASTSRMGVCLCRSVRMQLALHAPRRVHASDTG